MKTDAQIKADVIAELKWDAEVDETKIGVAVSNGAVTLTGHSPTFRQKMAAVSSAKRVGGVMAIVNNIEVLLDREFRTTDEGLAERIANVLKWNVSIPGKEIKATVKNGIVTLTGQVDWQYQRSNILRNIEHVGGVVNVVDLITLKPMASTTDVQKKIKDALQRHADVEASKVAVTVANGIVTLSGTVESMEEMDRVEDAAWAAPGVSKVIDNLRVAA
jgi:osmotically-inducible protein OsmY